MLKPGVQGDLQKLAKIALPQRFGVPCPELAFAGETIDTLQRRGEQLAFQKLPELANAGQQAQALGFIGFSIGVTLIVSISDYFPRRVILETDNVLALGLVRAGARGGGSRARAIELRLRRFEP